MTLPPARLAAVYEFRREQYAIDRGKHAFQPYVAGQKLREYDAIWNVTLETNLMDRLIDWKLRSPAVAKKMKTSAIAEEAHLIRQFTIELRVNYADNEKNDVMRKAVAAAARHVQATAVLLADGVQPDIAIFSDDWFAGREEIKLLEDVIQTGLDETKDTITEGEVSSELMAAVRDSA